ncbi:MAG: carbohydrate kinase [Bacteroidetes bacterium]|nr:carbohydrate kinase [Bacteroidota bacterium]
MTTFIAVLDIGKTNKKLLIYDQNLNIVDQKKQHIPEIVLDDIQREDLDTILEWFRNGLKEYAAQYNIKAISVSTHGATFVGLDANGNLPIPVISYTHDPGDEFQQRFFLEFGDRHTLQRTTATPHFGALINPGKGLFFQKEKYPEAFDSLETILYYPQYFGYWLTGNKGADITYTGCHSYLWDFKKNTYSPVAEKLGIRNKMPKNVDNPFQILGKIRSELSSELGLSKDVVVTLGIHDSNSALLPYLITRESDFILNSTGTWCVVMHKEGEVAFNADDIGKTVFYNLNAFGDPVKTAIFMGGLEFEMYDKLLKMIHTNKPFPDFDKTLYQSVIDDKECFILPSVVRGSGQFPNSEARVTEKGDIYSYDELESGTRLPTFFQDSEKAYAVLNISLGLQTKVALDRAGMKKGMPIFIEGGFRHNLPYCKLITALYPDSKVYLTSLQEASAYGAAICAKAALENKNPSELKDSIQIQFTNVISEELESLDNYYSKFISHVETN